MDENRMLTVLNPRGQPSGMYPSYSLLLSRSDPQHAQHVAVDSSDRHCAERSSCVEMYTCASAT